MFCKGLWEGGRQWLGFVWWDGEIVYNTMVWFCLVRWWDCLRYNGLVLFGEMVRLFTIQWLGFGLGDGGYAVSGWARIKTVLPICIGHKEIGVVVDRCPKVSLSWWISWSEHKPDLGGRDQRARPDDCIQSEGVCHQATTATKYTPNVSKTFKGCFNLFKKHRSSLCKIMPRDNWQKVYSQCLHRSKQWHGKCSFPLWNLRSR